MGRPVITGIYTTYSIYSQAAMQNLYNNYMDSRRGDNGEIKEYEERLAGDATGYTTNKTYPGSGLTIYTATYYDDYNYTALNTFSYSVPSPSGFSNNVTYKTKGKITGEKNLILGTSTYITGAYFYDGYSRIIQTKRNNVLGGYNLLTTEYSFTGKPVLTYFEAYESSSATTPGINITNRYIYDHADRLIDTYQKINNNTEILLSRLSYNELGQVKSKKLHGKSDKEYLQNVNYKYNIRGWLTGINNTDLNDGEGDLFGMALYYNSLPSAYNPCTTQYNGNIAAVEWTGTGTFTGGKHGYTFKYDGINRLLQSYYFRNRVRQNTCDANATYDANGNILTFGQNAYKSGGSYQAIDNITNKYWGNKLIQTSDEAADDPSRGDFFENTAYNGFKNGEYVYDANGNLTKDNNRGMVIDYNELNLPKKVTVGSNNITYTYDCKGLRLQKTVLSGGVITNYYFLDNVVKQNSNIAYVITAEGRAVKSGTAYNYEYFLKDHLGNVRVSFTDSSGYAKKLQEDHYYPFGLKMPLYSDNWGSTPSNKYLYSGKEIQDDITGINFYDFLGRTYDTQNPRFWHTDPMAEKYRRWSPYNYCMDNPLRFTDPDGMDPKKDEEEKRKQAEREKAEKEAKEENDKAQTQSAIENTKPKPTTAVSDATATVKAKPDPEFVQPAVPTCENKTIDVDLSLEAGDISVSQNGISVGGVGVVNKSEGVDLGIISANTTTETVTRLEPIKIDGKSVMAPVDYVKQVITVGIGLNKAEGCVVTRGGIIIENTAQSGFQVPIPQNLLPTKFVGGTISIMPFKRK